MLCLLVHFIHLVNLVVDIGTVCVKFTNKDTGEKGVKSPPSASQVPGSKVCATTTGPAIPLKSWDYGFIPPCLLYVMFCIKV